MPRARAGPILARDRIHPPETVSGGLSKLNCTCGHVTVDLAGLLPYKARLIADADQERLWDGVAQDLAA